MSGKLEVIDVPRPALVEGHILIANRCSVISAGTERTLVEFAKAGLIKKARQQPDRVKATLAKMKTDGLLSTIQAVRNKLDQPITLGYSAVGIVLEVGHEVRGFAVGDRVVNNGSHAEVVCVPSILCAKVPENVSDDDAAFTVICAIALQGIRLIQPTLGERIVVSGLGLIGLITVQILKAQGCHVLGLDFDPARLALAKTMGAEIFNLTGGADPLKVGLIFSQGLGVDAVIVAASTQSSTPIHQAAQLCRKRGRIVLVGVTGLELQRGDFYEKELTFQVSCSYGPGRYDASYEKKGQDYPLGFVRWTAQRNFEAVLGLMNEGKLRLIPLITARYKILDAYRAYANLTRNSGLGLLLEYDQSKLELKKFNQTVAFAINDLSNHRREKTGTLGLGFIGAGSYASAILIPAFKAANARLVSVVSMNGFSGVQAARKFGFENASTNIDEMLENVDVDTVVISTRHDSHASLAERAIAAGKHVYLEKPLALTLIDVNLVRAALLKAQSGGKNLVFMVGFNRRFAPQIQKMKSLVMACPGPRSIVITANVGEIPSNHWAQDRALGGGRILGEACHFIDLLVYLNNAAITKIEVMPMQSQNRDTASINLGFADGSIGTIHYFANGNRGFSKERVEIFQQGQVLVLDNFRKLTGIGWRGFKKQNLWRQDKGQWQSPRAFVEAAMSGGAKPIPLDEIFAVAETSIKVAQLAEK